MEDFEREQKCYSYSQIRCKEQRISLFAPSSIFLSLLHLVGFQIFKEIKVLIIIVYN